MPNIQTIGGVIRILSCVAGTDATGRYFKVSTKSVRNGELQQTITWEFSKYKTDMWRYETNTMDGTHTTVVIPKSRIFEFCMNQIGWGYTIRGSQGLSYYY